MGDPTDGQFRIAAENSSKPLPQTLGNQSSVQIITIRCFLGCCTM